MTNSEVVIATKRSGEGPAERLGRKLRQLEAQLPEGERALLASILTAASLAGIVVSGVEAVDDRSEADSPPSSVAAAPPSSNEAVQAIRDQFDRAYTPGVAWMSPDVLDIKLDP